MLRTIRAEDKVVKMSIRCRRRLVLVHLDLVRQSPCSQAGLELQRSCCHSRTVGVRQRVFSILTWCPNAVSFAVVKCSSQSNFKGDSVCLAYTSSV